MAETVFILQLNVFKHRSRFSGEKLVCLFHDELHFFACAFVCLCLSVCDGRESERDRERQRENHPSLPWEVFQKCSRQLTQLSRKKKKTETKQNSKTKAKGEMTQKEVIE